MRIVLVLLLLPLLMWGQDQKTFTYAQGARLTSFSMSTQNGLFGPHDELQDYYAQSLGLEYLAKGRWKNWSLNLDLYGTTLLAGNPFEVDSITGKVSRYESGLLAVDKPERRTIFVPSEAELVYQKDKLRFGLGNFALDGTFVNMEHGRMIPSTNSGLNASYRSGNLKLEGAGIFLIGARSTSGFKTIGESLAQYNPGLDTAGFVHDKSQVNAYALWYASAEHIHNVAKWYGQFKTELYIIPGVFGTFVANEVLGHNQYLVQLQYVRQFKLGNGGNDDPLLAYFQQRGSQYFGVKYSHKVSTVDYFAAASYIDKNGKLLFPREWGREYLVTFQGRERQEGMGNTLAVVVGASGKWQQGQVNHNGGVSTGIYVRPDPADYKYNKYGIPSNQQTNLWWGQSWKGGRHKLQFLAVLKVPLSSQTLTAGQTLNKVDMVNLNLVYRYTIFPQ